jgi:hypothetical protein
VSGGAANPARMSGLLTKADAGGVSTVIGEAIQVDEWGR